MSGDEEAGVPRHSSFDAVVKRLRSTFPDVEWDVDAPIGTLPIDSLEVLELVSMLEEEADIEFDVTGLTPEELDVISVREVYGRLQALVG